MQGNLLCVNHEVFLSLVKNSSLLDHVLLVDEVGRVVQEAHLAKRDVGEGLVA